MIDDIKELLKNTDSDEKIRVDINAHIACNKNNETLKV